MDDRPTHYITITVNGQYVHGEGSSSSVMVAGNGDSAHFLGAFRAALVAAGFSTLTAEDLDYEPKPAQLTFGDE